MGRNGHREGKEFRKKPSRSKKAKARPKVRVKAKPRKGKPRWPKEKRRRFGVRPPSALEVYVDDTPAGEDDDFGGGESGSE